jgi:acetolactate synthase-1/2/3 large subunit
VKLAEILAARVISSPVRVNFPTDHPLCAGLDPIGGGSRSLAHYLTEADVVLLIDYDLPYAAMPISPSPEAKIIYLTLDSTKKRYPLWNKKPALFLEADSRGAIPKLYKIIQSNLSTARKADFSARAKRIGLEHQKTRDEQRATAKNRSAQKPICPDWLCQCISKVVDKDAIIVNQTITQSGFVAEQIFRSQPHSLLGCAGGSIGWALGAALGAKIAAKDKTVVSLMGDGAFIWGCPESTLWTAKTYQAPFLAVIFNNRAYAAIKGLVQRAYGEEKISAQTGLDSGVDINSPPDYAKIAEACGAYGRTVKEPSEVLPALRAALSQVKRGRAAVVDVWL